MKTADRLLRSQLSFRQKKMARLYVAGCTPKEIAHACQVPIHAVYTQQRSRLFRLYARALEADYLRRLDRQISFLKTAAYNKIKQALRSKDPTEYQWAAERVLRLTSAYPDAKQQPGTVNYAGTVVHEHRGKVDVVRKMSPKAKQAAQDYLKETRAEYPPPPMAEA